MNPFSAQSGERSGQLPEVDKPVVEARFHEVMRAVTNVLDLESRLGETPATKSVDEQRNPDHQALAIARERYDADLQDTAAKDIAVIEAQQGVSEAYRGGNHASAA